MKCYKYLFVLFIFFLIFFLGFNYSYADINSLKTSMNGVTSGPPSGIESGGVGKILNTGIGLIQVAGTGISLIVVALLGIKYMIATVDEKASIKKQAIPILIGCVLLFGAVNIAKIIEDLAKTSLS